MKLLAMAILAIAVFGSGAAAQERAATAQTRFVDVAGNRIAYRSFGSGTPLLLLNRMRGTLDTWDPQFLDQLARTHALITVDYPGTGYSAGKLPADMGDVAAFVSDFTTKIGVKKFAVLGWSWGGLASQAVLLHYPERVSHAILLGTAPPGPGQPNIQTVWMERALKPVNDLDDEVILFFEPKSAASREAAKASRDRIYARPGVVDKIPSTQEEFKAFFAAYEGFRADSAGLRTQLTKTRVPIMVLCGDNDTSVPAANWYPLIGQIPRGQLIVLPESGHGPQHQYPELSAQYIDAFLKSR
jgi:pimeloyl-ACP methyl ester carboxylesterase